MSSYDTEADWDYLFVEARPVGTEDWTTLAITDDDGNVLTVTRRTTPGDSCADDGSHWSEELHPQLVHYMTVTGEDTCDPVGHDRRVERAHRQLRRLAAPQRRPGRLLSAGRSS